MAQILSIQNHLSWVDGETLNHPNGSLHHNAVALDIDLKDSKMNGSVSSTPGRAAIDIEWKDISYSVSLGRRKGSKTILKSLSGKVLCGELTAVLGPSGAGKSTLLNILSGYIHRNIQGNVYINGRDRDIRVFKKLSCYIMQEDHLLSSLTVKDHLWVATNLKMPQSTSIEQKKKIVNNAIDSLGLAECQDTKAGCLSGGQKKRLCIAQEIVNNPPVIFLDEPTSGLDSSSCLQCINLLKSLAKEGRTVVCTIHQPSARILEMFDKLYMVAEGKCIFRGPVPRLLFYLSSQGLECPQYHNPADFVTEVACGEYGKDCVDSLAAAAESLLPISGIYLSGDKEESQTTTSLDDDKTEDSCCTTSLLKERDIILRADYRGYPTSSLNQFIVLLKRVFLLISRDTMLTHLRMLSTVSVAILLGLLYYNIGNDAMKVYSNMSFIFFSLLFVFFCASMPTLLTFPLEAAVFTREHMNGWYSVRMYYLAKTLADLPFQLLFPTIYCSIVYFLTGQPFETSRFILFVMLMMIVSFVGQSFAVLIGAAIDIQNAVYLGPLLNLPMFIFCGFFIPVRDMPSYLQWLTYISYFRYAFEATMIIIYGYDRADLDCDPESLCIFVEPHSFLEELSINEFSVPVCFLILGVFLLAFRIIGYFVLKYKVHFRK